MTFRLNGERAALLAFLALFFLLQLAVLFRHNINWDEYLFLSQIYGFADGRLNSPLQTFHVELLGWLVRLPLSEPDQIVTGRLVMLLCEAGSLLCLYRIAREFVSVENALFAVVAWSAAGHALVHGASFRTDPLAGFLMMASLALLTCAKMDWRAAVGAGTLAAIGLLVTIKSALFAPAFLGALAWRWRRDAKRSSVVWHFLLAGALLLVACMILWTLHKANLAEPLLSSARESGPPSVIEQANGILDKMILSQSLLPRLDYIVPWAAMSMLSLFLCVLGLASAAWRNLPGGRGTPFLPTMLFAAPLLSLIIYRNAFPYFFPFIMLPAAVSAGLGAERLGARLRRVLLGAMALPLLAGFALAWGKDQAAQRQVASVAHSLFPEPVPYIETSGLLPSFPKVGFFMSTWGVESYRARGKASVTADIVRGQPPLLILSLPVLRNAMLPGRNSSGWALLPEDAETLQSNYLPHWGPIWVAGKNLPKQSGTFEILIAGVYTLECMGGRQIDGEGRACGSADFLLPGPHSWSGGEGTLRWGDHLPIPRGSPPTEPIYAGF